MGTMALIGFASGLPLALSGSTLQAWLASVQVDIRTIGLFSLAGLPYVCKFLWAPLLDRFVPPWPGRRRGWMLISQIAVMFAITAMALLSPDVDTTAIAVLACLLALLSATQDIAVDAYRADLLPPKERGLGAAVSVTGYRIAMIVSGAGALLIADTTGWLAAYLAMAVFMGAGLAVSLFGPEPAAPAPLPRTLDEAVVLPFREFLGRERALWFLGLIVLYKIGDAFAGSLTTAFLIRGPGFSLTEVGVAYKAIGIAASVAGALAGGALMLRIGLFRALLVFGVLQAVTNLGFMALAWIGRDFAVMTAVVALENLAGGMGTAAFVALLMALCDRRFSATQYALLSALSAVGRVVVGPAAGYAVAAMGWVPFFAATVATALPGLLLLLRLRRPIEVLERN
jgi:PAT family beta-lactamase induction signal transducer AmpG